MLVQCLPDIIHDETPIHKLVEQEVMLSLASWVRTDGLDDRSSLGRDCGRTSFDLRKGIMLHGTFW